MQFFKGGFTPKKSTPRKAKLPMSMESCPQRLKQLGLDIDDIQMKLGNVTSTFQDGSWIHDISSSHNSQKVISGDVIHLRNFNEKLLREKNMLRVKNEILIDTVTCKNIKIQEMETEMKQLRGILAKSPLRFVEEM